jgi:predicted kinase
MSRIVIVSGPPGAGKTTVCRWLAQRVRAPLAMHLRTDDIYTYVRKGFIPPWMPEAHEQNQTLVGATVAQAVHCANRGYHVFVDGVIGPWFLDLWRDAIVGAGVELDYLILLPSEDVAANRAASRRGKGEMTDPEVARRSWRSFQAQSVNLRHIVDNSDADVGQTLDAVLTGLADGRFRVA